MDVLASLLLLRMTYRERTGPETFSGEDSKPDYRHIEPGCCVIRAWRGTGLKKGPWGGGCSGSGAAWRQQSGNRGMRAMGSGSQCQDSRAKGAAWMGRGGSLGEAGSREGGSTGGPSLSTWRSGRAWRK